MGNWHISVRGVGSHHNTNNPNDADRMAQEFVTKLKNAGHSVKSAAITYGAEQELDIDQVTPLPNQTES